MKQPFKQPFRKRLNQNRVEGALPLTTPLAIIEQDALSNSEINQYLPDAKIMTYDKLASYKTIDDLLPNNNDYAVILYEHSQNVGHWVCVLKYDDLVEYFDSYGGKVDNPLNWINCKTRKALGSNNCLLTNMLDECPYDVIYNPIVYQSKSPKIATCGRHCVFRILNLLKKNMDLEGYYSFMKREKKKTGLNYDKLVSKYISIV